MIYWLLKCQIWARVQQALVYIDIDTDPTGIKMTDSTKRQQEDDKSESEDELVGPMPAEVTASDAKKR